MQLLFVSLLTLALVKAKPTPKTFLVETKENNANRIKGPEVGHGLDNRNVDLDDGYREANLEDGDDLEWGDWENKMGEKAPVTNRVSILFP